MNSNLIDDFLDYMKSTKGASDNTVKEYYYDLRMFARFIKRRKGLVDSKIEFDHITIEDISPDLLESVTKQDIYAYNAFLERERKISNRSKFRKISSIRSFYNYLHAKIDIIKINPVIDIDMPKVEKTLPVYLTLDQSLNLLKTIEESKIKPLYKKRDYAIVTLFLNCGMRLSELAGMDISHLQEDNTLKVIGKGNKERVIYLNEASVCTIIIRKQKVLLFLLLIFIFNTGLMVKNESDLNLEEKEIVYDVYTVKSGDTIWTISDNYDYKNKMKFVMDIEKANGISSYDIKPGYKLAIPIYKSK
ncbi:site-specific integrase [Peptoniphilus genitalis]